MYMQRLTARACSAALINVALQCLTGQGSDVQPMRYECLFCSVLREPARQLGRALCWAHLNSEELDLLPLLCHGRALGVCGRVPPVLGVCQPGMRHLQLPCCKPRRPTHSVPARYRKLCLALCVSNVSLWAMWVTAHHAVVCAHDNGQAQ